MSEFTDAITKAYAVEGAAIDLGRGVHDDETDQAAAVRVPLAMMNRHGLVAGATGTGKTKTLQGMAEQLSAAGVPVFIADVKGDVSGVCAARRARRAGREAHGRSSACRSRRPASRSSSSRSAGSGPASRCARPSRTSARSCWPRSSTPTRRRSRASPSSSTTPTARACRCSTSPTCGRCSPSSTPTPASPSSTGIGGLSSATVGVLLRALVGSRPAAATSSSAEPQLDVADLLRTAPDGRGIISCSSCPPSRTSRGSSRPR